MNRLKPEKQTAILSALVEGASIRSVERMTGTHRDTITRLLLSTGRACEMLLDEKMRGLSCEHVQMDEIWCYVSKKQRHVKDTDNRNKVGDFWTWIAMDADTKLVPTYLVGKRDFAHAQLFLADLASRLTNRVLLSTDGLNLYVPAIMATFGPDVDYAKIVKTYEAEPLGPGRYSPPKVVSIEKTPLLGSPDMRRTSTSYVERGNLTLRMHQRRFTRLTNGFSKRFEGLEAAVALHFAWYNLIRTHKTLGTTPGVAAGVVDRPWKMEELVDLVRA